MFQNMSSKVGRGSTLTLVAVAVVQFMVSLDLSVVNVGLPQIAAGLGFAGASLTWVIHAYALTFGGLLLLGGKTADALGRRRILLLGIALFGLASLLGGCSAEPWQLVAARAAQGVGAAAAAPAALALLTTEFPEGRPRVRAFGVWSAVNASGGALGVLLGGLLTEFAGWRWVMFVNVPMALVALALASRIAPDQAVRRSRPDVLGAVLATAGAGVLVFGVVRTETVGWGSLQTIGTLAAAAAILAAFVLTERRTRRDPLVRPGLFRNRSVTGANAYNLLLGAAMAASFYFLSLYLQRVLDSGPATAGLMFLPFALGVVAGSVLSVRLRRKITARALLIAGGLLACIGFAWFALIDAAGSFGADVLGPSVVTSLGFGLALAPVASTATEGVAAHEAGVASGLLNSSRQLGAALGLAALGASAQVRAGSATTTRALTDGYAFGFILCAVLLAAAVLVALVILPDAHSVERSTARRVPDEERV